MMFSFPHARQAQEMYSAAVVVSGPWVSGLLVSRPAVLESVVLGSVVSDAECLDGVFIVALVLESVCGGGCMKLLLGECVQE